MKKNNIHHIKTIKMMKGFKIVAVVASLCPVFVSAQTIEQPLPGIDALITEQPAGNPGWYTRSCTKYMHLLGPLEYGGESSVPSKIVETDDGQVFMGGVFTDFEGCGWLTGHKDAETGDVILRFPQIMYDEDYNDDRYYYYACCVNLNDDSTDMEVSANQTLTLHTDDEGNLQVADLDTAIGICYVFDPDTNEQATENGSEGCELRWFGIAYSDIKWTKLKANAITIPEGVTTERYAMRHSTNARFVDIAVENNKIYLAGLMPDPKVCITADIASDGSTVIFPTNQFLGVSESEDFFYYFVAAAPETIPDPETGGFVETIAPTDKLSAKWDREKHTLTFVEPNTGFAIANGESKVGGGSLFMEPSFIRQEDYIADAPVTPEILIYNPYTEDQGYGTINFNLPFWNNDGLLINPENMYYNIYVDDEVLTLTTDVYQSLENSLADIPYTFTDNYDLFSVGLNHAVYLYSDGYDRIGVRSVTEVDGKKFYSPIAYVKSSSLKDSLEDDKAVLEIYYLDLTGQRIENPSGVPVIKCTRFADGSFKAEKVLR